MKSAGFTKMRSWLVTEKNFGILLNMARMQSEDTGPRRM